MRARLRGVVLALALAGTVGPVALPGTALAGPVDDGDAAWERGDLAGAIQHWGAAYADARAADAPADQVALGLRLAAALRKAGAVDDAQALLDQLAPVCTAAGDPALDLQRRVAVGQVQLARGDARKAADGLSTLFADARDAGQAQVAATTALVLGDARSAVGDHIGAGKAWAAAGQLFDTLGDRIGAADAASRQGIAAWEAGELGSGLSSLEQALSLYRAAGELTGEADAQTAMALLLVELGRASRAVELLEDALATARQRKDVLRQARLQLALGQLLARSGDADGARKRIQAAADAFASKGATDDAVAATIALGLLQGDADLLRRAHDEARRAKSPRVRAQAALALAQALDDAGQAEKLAREAEKLADSTHQVDIHWRALAEQGTRLLDQGRRAPGIEALQQAVVELERTRAGLEPDAAAGFVGSHTAVYERLIEALLAEGRDTDAFLYAQRLQLASLPAAGAADAPEAARYQALVAQEAFLAEALESEAAARDADSPRAKALREQLATLRVQFAEEVDHLRATWTGFDELVRLDPRDLEAVQADLDPGVVVVQPVLLGDQLVLMVVRRDGLRVVKTTVDLPAFDRQLRTLLGAMHMPGLVSPAAVTAAADGLGATLLDPIAAELASAEVLVLSPTGLFRHLPFSALRRDGHWLVEDVALARVTHVGSLRPRAGLAPRTRLAGTGLLLVGNPDGTLPGAEAEVRSIAAEMPGARVLIGAAGTEAALREHGVGKQAVHLATHGWVDPTRPEQSFLVLAPEETGDDAAPERDGRLTAREIPGLGAFLQDTRLVVLSACESAVPVDPGGPPLLGADGATVPRVSIEGLAAQFQRAGVETLVGSLWKVDDEGTQKLMEAFYAELAAGRDPARALATAQRGILAQERLSSPFYWAPFVLVGDWR